MMTTFEITAHEEESDTSVTLDLDYIRDLAELEMRLGDQLAAVTCLESHYWLCICNEDDPVSAQVEQDFIAAVRKRRRLDSDHKAVAYVLRRLHQAMIKAKLPCHHETDYASPIRPSSWTPWDDDESRPETGGDSPVGTPSSSSSGFASA